MIECIRNGALAMHFSYRMQASTRGNQSDAVGHVTMVMSYCNIFLNPLIYIFQYDVVRRSLIGFAHKIAAKFKSQQPPTTN